MSAPARPLYLAAVDLGATSGRVILGVWKKSRLELREVHRFPNAFRSLGVHDYWDVPGLWAQIQTGLRAAAAALPKGAMLASVGVDCWGWTMCCSIVPAGWCFPLMPTEMPGRSRG